MKRGKVPEPWNAPPVEDCPGQQMFEWSPPCGEAKESGKDLGSRRPEKGSGPTDDISDGKTRT